MSNHFRLEGTSMFTQGEENRIDLGKRGVLNNQQIFAGAAGDSCFTCHVAFSRADGGGGSLRTSQVNCLSCHDTMAQLTAGPDLSRVGAEVGKRIDRPTRANCGRCHFASCTGTNEKIGDLGPELVQPDPDQDIHMGRYNMLCQDCHKANKDKGASVNCKTCHSGPKAA